jgi:dsDNA-specific endonuclease/ATPase MutS2
MAKAMNLPSLDLHGAKTDEVFDRLDKFLRKEEGKGTRCVRIIHGIGTGKVKDKALEYCKLTRHQPKPDESSGKSNPGSFLLYL